MQLGKLDHVNIRTNQLSTMVDWYTAVLGMNSGYRPDFPFPGAWLYSNGVVSVHLIQTDDSNCIGSEASLKLEHFAFQASGRSDFEAHLRTMGETYHSSDVPSINLIQINIWDPDGNHIHIDFPADE